MSDVFTAPEAPAGGGAPASRNYDAVVIGGGHNGLVTAAYLAKEGLKTLVLERRGVLGGAAATEAVFPGYRANTGGYDAGLFLPQIVQDLNLENYGLAFLEPPALLTSLQPEGASFTLWRDPQRAQAEIERFSPADARKYPDFLRWVERLAGVLRPLLTLAPPPLPEVSYRELLPWLPAALGLKRLGDRDMMELLRLLPLSVADFLDEWFESPALKGALAVSAIAGSMQGPMASGTTFLFLYHALGPAGSGIRASRFIQGGAVRLSEALADAARQYGAEICTGVAAQRILAEDGRATGVLLESGELVSAPRVVSSAGPRRTFFNLVGAEQLELRLVREVKNIKFRGSTARLNLALDGLPRFDLPAEALGGHILLSPSLEYMERAYDDAKYGGASRQPILDMTLPSLIDPSVAPPGKHLLTIDVRYAPYHLKDTDWQAEGGALVDRVIDLLEGCAPGMKSLVAARQLLTPLDLEREYGLEEGSIYHGQMGLDQLLFMRPVPGYGSYRTPLAGLYLCGAGSHPGGGLTGAPGYNAAREILK